jgi:2-polyprenyl-3-methyl-5-hydroxy-6-metoxy-1,4-benzoquinol methylase
MYTKADYHDCHYEGKGSEEYLISAQILGQYIPAGASVLDYGCGVGGFLKALRDEGFVPFGVEFNRDAALAAGESANCKTMSVDDFQMQSISAKFDAIHFGDVLEHIPDPTGTLKAMLGCLKPEGVLFIEGPLETNPSLVYWAANLFGAIKRILRPNSNADHPPTHLFLTGAKQQKAFFSRAEGRLELKYWQVYETGWPYANGGLLKRAISRIAVSIGGRVLFGLTFGNRFRGIFIYRDQMSDRQMPIPVE